MTKVGIVFPDSLPCMRAVIFCDLDIVGDDLNVLGHIFSNEVVQDFSEHGFQTCGYDIERNAVIDTEFVELLEVRVDIECRLHDFEAVVERHIERGIQLIRDLAEGTLAGFELMSQDGTLVWTTAEVIEQLVASILDENRAVEVCTLLDVFIYHFRLATYQRSILSSSSYPYSLSTIVPRLGAMPSSSPLWVQD